MAERRVRTKEERIAELDKKIQYHKDKIALLEGKRSLKRWSSVFTGKM